ncbi:MAG: hypothetical protein E6Q97_30060 [Desulfurellales bacterium]|nr:MAG: hypothetical protein E6Q97_30060 [Desulfurellales bacterium]
MNGFISEIGNIVIPAVAASITSATTSAYINTRDCDAVECGILLQAGAGATSAENFTIEVLAASDASGTGAEVVSFEVVFRTLGAPGIAAGTGLATRLEQEVSAGVLGKVASYVTLAANGDKQEQIVIPIRARQLPAGKSWVALRATKSTNNRTGMFFFVRSGNKYATDANQVDIL